MNEKFLRKLFLLMLAFSLLVPTLLAEERVRTKVTVLVASNEGNDFDLVNDEYRDRLINLFSYHSYHEASVQAVELEKARRVKVDLPEGYELVLTYQGIENSRILVQALIRKNSQQYVLTVLSMPEQGVVFLGGPPVGRGVLVIVLETGF